MFLLFTELPFGNINQRSLYILSFIPKEIKMESFSKHRNVCEIEYTLNYQFKDLKEYQVKINSFYLHFLFCKSIPSK